MAVSNSTKPATRSGCKLVTLALFALIVGCGQEPLPEQQVIRPLRAIKVGDATALISREFPGQAKATQEVNLSFRVAGPLITFPVKVGDEVKAGDILARIDPNDFEVSVMNVEGELERAEAEQVLAEREYIRGAEVQKRGRGLISESEVDTRLAIRDRTRANVKALEASLRSAKDDLNYTHLQAPFDGTIVATYVENFEDVRAKQPVLRLLDTSQIEMTIDIPENLISLTAYVQNIRVRFDTFPDQDIPAEISEVGTEASETTRTYPVTLIMEQPEDFKILPGMAGKVHGEAQPPGELGEAGIEVPLSAIFTDVETDKTYVWVIDEGTQTVSRREVSTGNLTSHGVIVQQGLGPGEWIATAAVHSLSEGQQVRILQDSGTEG